MATTRQFKQEIDHIRATDPERGRVRTVRTEPRLNSIADGCCAPYPDVTYARSDAQGNPLLFMHHVGRQCMGYMEPREFSSWYFGKHGKPHA